MGNPDVTILLEALGTGESGAAERLFQAVYDELRAMAASKMRSERANHTLQPTALVHEAFVRLVGNQEQLTHRAQFFGAAARAMERVLVDHAREKAALKRGGDRECVTFDDVRDPGTQSHPGGKLGVIEVHDTLNKLEAEDPDLAHVVRCRYFLGMNLEEIAEVSGVSLSTVRRQWAFARAWLYDALGESDTGDQT